MRLGSWHLALRRRRKWLLSVLLLAATASGLAALRSTVPDAPGLVAYVACAGNNQIQVIDLTSGRTLRRLHAGATPWRLKLDPNGRRLWAEHWYSATTAVIDLETLDVERVLPVRGPGAFSRDGKHYLSFSWPSSAGTRFDTKTLQSLEERSLDVRNVYDIAAARDGKSWYLAQFDPMTQGPRQRYGYVLRYPTGGDGSRGTMPVSLPTGRSPAQVVVLENSPFVLSADRETNGLTLFNEHGARQAVATCKAPQRVIVSETHGRLAVVCWTGSEAHRSRVITYDVDFSARPWPIFRERGSRAVAGGLVSAAFAPGGDRFYAVDRVFHRLLELDFANAEVLRSVETGDVPVDLVLVTLGRAARNRLARSKSRGRRLLVQALARWRTKTPPPAGLSWVEQVRTVKRVSAAQDEAAEPARPERRSRVSFKWPDAFRTESEAAPVRLARGGYSISLEPSGRFWVAPRQELLSTALTLASLPEEVALKALSGATEHSPFLRGGLAIDLVAEKTEGNARYLVIGTLGNGEASSQLWLNAETGQPARLIEQFPTFGSHGHHDKNLSNLLETRFHDFEPVAGYPMPHRLERRIHGDPFQEVRIGQVSVKESLPEQRFVLATLGGADAKAELLSLVPTAPAGDQPGRAVPVLEYGYLRAPAEPHPPYNSSPPTSGPRLDYLADFGVHPVPVPLELQVHNLEHGGVGVQYHCREPCPELAGKLAALAAEFDDVFVAPYPFMTTLIALSAWGRLEILDRFDAAKIRRFIAAYAGRDHHRLDAGGHAMNPEGFSGAARARAAEAAQAARGAIEQVRGHSPEP